MKYRKQHKTYKIHDTHQKSVIFDYILCRKKTVGKVNLHNLVLDKDLTTPHTF